MTDPNLILYSVLFQVFFWPFFFFFWFLYVKFWIVWIRTHIRDTLFALKPVRNANKFVQECSVTLLNLDRLTSIGLLMNYCFDESLVVHVHYPTCLNFCSLRYCVLARAFGHKNLTLFLTKIFLVCSTYTQYHVKKLNLNTVNFYGQNISWARGKLFI